jgi:hypothetical protein
LSRNLRSDVKEKSFVFEKLIKRAILEALPSWSSRRFEGALSWMAAGFKNLSRLGAGPAATLKDAAFRRPLR